MAITIEFLKGMGLDDEAIKGENVTSEEFKQKYEELAEQIKKQSEEAEKLKADEVLTNAIVEAFGEKKDNFSSDYVRSGIIGDMKAEIAKSENKGKG